MPTPLAPQPSFSGLQLRPNTLPEKSKLAGITEAGLLRATAATRNPVDLAAAVDERADTRSGIVGYWDLKSNNVSGWRQRMLAGPTAL